ncbi:Hypothetical predicted protein [Marmota monax]|uniref:Uncharacterized protein n=1 Tax=Marmota monax TaxID=9995 RepID=A0A5E4BPU7_MARMO|nr:hypothetical protein GHT09_007101 [Marmota monax]VTJ71587.1 Hypothetical predicted protein [Marmota monax]
MTRAKLDSQNIGARRSLRASVVSPFFPFHPTEEAAEAQSAHCQDMPTATATEQPGRGRLLTQRRDTLTSPGPPYTYLALEVLSLPQKTSPGSEMFIEGPNICGQLLALTMEERGVCTALPKKVSILENDPSQ